MKNVREKKLLGRIYYNIQVHHPLQIETIKRMKFYNFLDMHLCKYQISESHTWAEIVNALYCKLNKNVLYSQIRGAFEYTRQAVLSHLTTIIQSRKNSMHT